MEPTNKWNMLIERLNNGYVCTQPSPNDDEYIYSLIINDTEELMWHIVDHFDEAENFKKWLKTLLTERPDLLE